MTGTVTFGNRTIGKGNPVEIALSVTDILDSDAVAQRVGMIIDRTFGLGCFGSICIRDDLHSPEAFAESAAVVAGIWDGGIILESQEAASIVSAMPALEGRDPLVCGLDPLSASMVASMFGCPVAVRSSDPEELLDYVEEAGTDRVVLDPMFMNIKSVLENATDLNRLSELVPQADHPVMVKGWSGEYAVSMASLAILRYCSLVVVDDLDRDGCEVLELLSGSAGAR